MTDTHASPLMTITEAAAYLKMSRSSMYRLLKTHEIPTLKIFTRGQLIDKRVLDELIITLGGASGRGLVVNDV